nr:ribonuclease H-like domain-containing protein [Tanacetum cinerariifolium]
LRDSGLCWGKVGKVVESDWRGGGVVRGGREGLVSDGVLNQLEGLRNSFFLGADLDERKMTWVRFNRLYSLDLQKDSSIAQKMQNSDWANSFRRLPRGGGGLKSVNGVFSVKSAREEIDKHLLVTSSSPTRWSKLLPIKVNVFSWRMILDKLPTRVNLSNRGMDIPCVLCSVCDIRVESRNHLFFGCSMACDLYRLISRWWNIHIPNLLDPLAWEDWFNGLRLNNMQSQALWFTDGEVALEAIVLEIENAKSEGSTCDVVSNSTFYQSLAGSIQYLTFTMLDISYAVQQVYLHMHDPREPHFSGLKRILRYVCGTLDYGLQLFSSSTTDLVAYLDADWIGCPTTWRSTSGYCVFFGNNLLSWSAKRQPRLSHSGAEAEYRGVANAVADTCWLRSLLRELHTPLSFATLVYCDNVSVVYLSCNPIQHQRTKHIEIDIHFVQDLVVRSG